VGHFGIRVVIIEPGYIAPGMKAGETHPASAAYAELAEQWPAPTSGSTPRGATGPELAARAIADSIEDPTTPLRVEVGDDATMVLAARRQLDDAAFESAMREVVGLTW